MVLAQVSGKIGNELQTFRTLDVSYPTLDILYPNAGQIVPNPWPIHTLPLFDFVPWSILVVHAHNHIFTSLFTDHQHLHGYRYNICLPKSSLWDCYHAYIKGYGMYNV